MLETIDDLFGSDRMSIREVVLIAIWSSDPYLCIDVGREECCYDVNGAGFKVVDGNDGNDDANAFCVCSRSEGLRVVTVLALLTAFDR